MFSLLAIFYRHPFYGYYGKSQRLSAVVFWGFSKRHLQDGYCLFSSHSVVISLSRIKLSDIQIFYILIAINNIEVRLPNKCHHCIGQTVNTALHTLAERPTWGSRGVTLCWASEWRFSRSVRWLRPCYGARARGTPTSVFASKLCLQVSIPVR